MKKNILITLTLCLIPIVIFADNGIIRFIVLLVFLYIWHILLLSICKDSPKQSDKSFGESIDELKNQNIKLVEHMRHELLNHFQVVMGYIQLQKIEKVTEYLNNVKMQSYHDSSLSRLGIPSLIHYLLHVRIQESLINIDWEIGKDIRTEALIVDQETFSQFIQVFIHEWLQHAATISHSSQLMIKFEATEVGLQIKCMFSGQYDESTLEDILSPCRSFYQLDPTIQVKTSEADSQIVIDSMIPYRSE